MWLAAFTFTFLSVTAFGQNINDLIENHDIDVGPIKTQVQRQENASYDVNPEGKTEIITSNGQVTQPGRVFPAQKYRLEVSRAHGPVDRISEALVRGTLPNLNSTEVKSFQFDAQGRLSSATTCAADTSIGSGLTDISRKHRTDCVTLTNEFCRFATATIPAVNPQALMQCRSMFDAFAQGWNLLGQFVEKSADYQKRAKDERATMTSFVSRSVKGLETKWVLFDSDEQKDATATIKKDSENIAPGWNALTRFWMIRSQCDELAPYFNGPPRIRSADASSATK